MAPTRRLAAILAADVVGYSRLMGADEEGTHEHLKAHLRELVEPKIKEHRGRIVKNTGDARAAPVALRLVESLRSAQRSSPRSALRSRVRMTLCRRGMDSNHRYQEDKRPLRDGLCLASAAKQ